MAATKYDRGMPGLVAPMTLPPGEPAAGPWRAIREEDLVRVLFNAGSVSPRKPLIVAVDGRGASGKTTPVSYTHLTLPTTPYV